MVRWLSGNTRPGCERTFMFLKSQKRRYEYTERMTEIVKGEKVAIKKELSIVEETCTVYLKEDVKEESIDIQGSVNCLIYNILLFTIYWNKITFFVTDIKPRHSS